jgi:SAM-dependent methyltransferase
MDDALNARYGSEAGAEAYASKYEGSLLRRWSSRRERRLVARLVREAGAHGEVLDVPCAAGRMVPTLVSLGARVTAVDASPAMVEVARRALRPRTEAGTASVLSGDARRLPFADRSFDVVVCWRLLHHLVERSERLAVLAEVARVSRGAVVASFADPTTLRARLQRLRGRRRRCAFLAPEELAAEASEAGLDVVSTTRLASAFSHLSGALLRRRGA